MIEHYGDQIETIELVRSSKGRFEVTVDGHEIYAKSRTKRHAQPGEILSIMSTLYTPDPHADHL